MILKGVRVRSGQRCGVLLDVSRPWVAVQWDGQAESESVLRSCIDDYEVSTADGWLPLTSFVYNARKRERELRQMPTEQLLDAAVALLHEDAASKGFKGNPYDISKDAKLKPTRGMKFSYKSGPYAKARDKANRWDCKCPGNNSSGYNCTCKDKENPDRKPKRFKVAAGSYKTKYMRAWRKFRAAQKRT